MSLTSDTCVPSSSLERIHRVLGLAHLTQPGQAWKSVITISTMDVLHCLVTSEMTAVLTGMSRM
jgi:hypothetical protein